MRFALCIGNRGFFPGHLIAQTREQLKRKLSDIGHTVICLGENETRYGAVETKEEGKKFAAFLERNKGSYDGVILSLPNFGDENGGVTALENCGVPIYIHAYPDEIGKMDFANRRDSFCGKISMMDVFNQCRIPYTCFPPHTLDPESALFDKQIGWFASVCRIVRGMKKMTVGGIGARTTAFKTVRFDEVTLQKYGITTESLDLSEVLMRYKNVQPKGERYETTKARMSTFSDWSCTPDEKFENIVRLGVVLDEIVEEYDMDALALRCWIELERELGVSPCAILGDLNERGIMSACELDVCNAVSMRALYLASGKTAACLDWNNNYGDDDNKCILFHCGPVPPSMMKGDGHIVEQPMFAKSFSPGCGWGCNAGRIAASPFTYASSKTEDGKFSFYIGEGEITDDEIEPEFFGCACVVRIDGLQDKLLAIGKNGYRHHVSITHGEVGIPLKEAFCSYLKYDVADF